MNRLPFPDIFKKGFKRFTSLDVVLNIFHIYKKIFRGVMYQKSLNIPLKKLLVQAPVIFFGVLLLYGADAGGATLRVSEGGYTTIQEAIDAALSGDTVLVADGVYKGFGNRNLDFKGKAIVVRSERGPGYTIIDCEYEARGFYFHSWEKRRSVVSGFTITRGYGKYQGGGGIYCYGSSPTINNCRIKEEKQRGHILNINY